jgi:DNA processing protein
LKQIHNPPFVIYSSGSFSSDRMISIVGTRNSESKSEKITELISSRAAAEGYSVVSGMALGIDRSAHRGALDAGGSTVAVLPGGIDIIYPSKNIDIYRRITSSENSAVISEYPPGIGTAQKWTFAKRNRIISGLSGTVIVIQAPLKSGALITAGYAIEQNRDLFVCPGNAFDEKYSGCNELIRQGASILSDMNDLFYDTNSDLEREGTRFAENKISQGSDKLYSGSKQKQELNEAVKFDGEVEKLMFEQLKNGTIEIDKFIRSGNYSADQVNQALTILEIEGIAVRKGGKIYKI